jgi:hypothetical protein
MQSSGAVTSPDVGSAGSVTLADFVSGRYGNGARFDADGEFITLSAAANFDPNRGAIEFWYQPNYDFGSGAAAEDHGFFGYWIDASNFFYALHQPYLGGAGNLEGIYLQVSSGGVISEAITGTGPSFPVLWRATEWVHLRFAWDVGASRLEIYVNGELRASAPYTAAPALPGDDLFYVGERNRNNNPINNAEGIIDEFRMYSDPDAPTRLAFAGLTGNADEYLASTTSNFTLAFNPLDGSGRGEYLYLGADSKFRGLNVGLDQEGAGVAAGALQWQYWDGGNWANLESVGGFTDETESLTKRGTVYWTSDPPTWSLYSVAGGPDLYFVRVYLPAGSSYTTTPIEALIKTDILLFQYCGDITAPAQTFQFTAPPPTAVELLSLEARALDGAVEVEWHTGSELDNLGFHLYRATSQAGPYQRITASVIPGLGSSPEGARYRYEDGGLTNGVTYYYKLEDIETTGKTEFHGPVSATPEAGLPAGDNQEGEEGSEGGSGDSTARIVFGDPGANQVKVRRRDRRGVEIELLTEGFYAYPEEGGTVRLEVPDFVDDELEVPDFVDDEASVGPDIPVYRSWLEAIAGRQVNLVSVRTEDVQRLTGLQPSSSEATVITSQDGVVRAGRRNPRQARSAERSAGQGFYAEEWARLVSVGFQGDVKKALVELAPLRWDTGSGGLVLARRLVVRLSFVGLDLTESSLGGSRGRGHQEGRGHGSRSVMTRLALSEPGLYGVSFESVYGEKRRLVATSELRLSRQGEPVAFHVEPKRERFGPGSVLYFVSEGASLSPYGQEVVYELEGSGEGKPMEELSGAPSGTVLGYYWKTLAREENLLYQAAFLEAEDIWQWDWLMGGMVKSFPFTVTNLSSVPESSRLEVWGLWFQKSGGMEKRGCTWWESWDRGYFMTGRTRSRSKTSGTPGRRTRW